MTETHPKTHPKLTAALDWASLALAPAAYLLAGALVLTLIRAAGADIGSIDFTCAWDVTVLVTGVAVMRKVCAAPERCRLSDKGQLAVIAFCVAMFFVAQCAATVVYALTQDAAFARYAQTSTNAGVVQRMLLTVVLAPVVEEVLFRGIVFRLVAKHSQLWVAALVSSVAFAATHGTLVHMLPATLMGLTCCAAYVLTGRLGCSVVVHVAYNAFSIYAPFIPVAQVMFVPLVTIPLALAMCAACCLVMRDKNKWQERLCRPNGNDGTA